MTKNKNTNQQRKKQASKQKKKDWNRASQNV